MSDNNSHSSSSSFSKNGSDSDYLPHSSDSETSSDGLSEVLERAEKKRKIDFAVESSDEDFLFDEINFHNKYEVIKLKKQMSGVHEEFF